MRHVTLATILFSTFLTGCWGGHELPRYDFSKNLKIEPVTGAEYYLLTPEDCPQDKPVKAIVACHGLRPWDSARTQFRLWREHANNANAILVCPKLDDSTDSHGERTKAALLSNERTILSILSKLGREYKIDRKKTMITGSCSGGLPACWIGLRHPDIFSMIAIQDWLSDTTKLNDLPTGSTDVPILIYYGLDGSLEVIVASKKAIHYLKNAGFNVTESIIPNYKHSWHPEVAMEFFENNGKKPQKEDDKQSSL